jgi:hypothetical protein
MSNTGPRLFQPDDDPPPFLVSEPLPIQMRRNVVETATGTITDFLVVWKVGANRCRFCPQEKCTFLQSSDPKIGSCTIRTEGDRSSPFVVP